MTLYMTNTLCHSTRKIFKYQISHLQFGSSQILYLWRLSTNYWPQLITNKNPLFDKSDTNGQNRDVNC